MDGYKYKRSEKGLFLPIIDEDSTNGGIANGLVQRSVISLVESI